METAVADEREKLDALVDRLDITDLTVEQIEPLEQLMQEGWSDVWKDFARSCYVTLVSAGGRELAECARMAVLLTLGIAQDLGGRQPYIQAGAELLKNRRMQRVMELLSAGQPYHLVASATKLTEARVRQVERSWRAAKAAEAAERYARAQSTLPL